MAALVEVRRHVPRKCQLAGEIVRPLVIWAHDLAAIAACKTMQTPAMSSSTSRCALGTCRSCIDHARAAVAAGVVEPSHEAVLATNLVQEHIVLELRLDCQAHRTRMTESVPTSYVVNERGEGMAHDGRANSHEFRQMVSISALLSEEKRPSAHQMI